MTLALLAHELEAAVVCESCERALASFLVGDPTNRDDDAPLFLVCATCLPTDDA